MRIGDIRIIRGLPSPDLISRGQIAVAGSRPAQRMVQRSQFVLSNILILAGICPNFSNAAPVQVRELLASGFTGIGVRSCGQDDVRLTRTQRP